MRKIKICRVDVCIVSIDDALKKGKTFFFLFFLFFRDFSELREERVQLVQPHNQKGACDACNEL